MYFFYFYPLGLDRQATRPPVLTRLITVVMVVAFLWMRYRPEALGYDPWNLVFYPGNAAPWTAITALFLHSGWLHLLGNIIYFNVFGPPLEDRLGSGTFLLVFLLVGSFGNLVHGLVSVWGLLGTQGVGVLGASGALAGLLAFAMVRFYSARVLVGWWVFAPLAGQNRAGKSHLPIGLAAAGWLLLQLAHTLVARETGASVSYGAHLGGFSMGLGLALILGQLSAGRTETRRVQALEYFTQGAYHASVGAWTEYLSLNPEDEQARLGRARALRMVGQTIPAFRDYHHTLRRLLARRELDEALELYREIRRAELTSMLPPDTLQTLATFMEKQWDYEGARGAYQELYTCYPATAAGQRALVRLVHLYHGKLADPFQAAHWLDVACRKLPGGTWREYLLREFTPEAGPDAADAEGPGQTQPATGP
jgi:membrane associated rhomboid family serine protease|nr:rhomboid family intramembrane serine protease [Candidatus Krumholzibacteria bacterium]